jgi:hypothetical protein
MNTPLAFVVAAAACLSGCASSQRSVRTPPATRERLQRLIKRSHEIEEAADLEPGSVINDFIEGAHSLWFPSESDFTGWG